MQDSTQGWVAGGEALEDVTVPGVRPGSRPSAGFSNSGSLPVSTHQTVHSKLFSSAFGDAGKYFG